MKKNSSLLKDEKLKKGNAVVEGRNTVYEALRGPRKVKLVYIDKSISKNIRLKQVSNLAKDKSVHIKLVDRNFLNKIGTQHQGVIAITSPYKYFSLSSLLNEIRNKNPVIVLLDGIKDPQNFGAILRTCQAFSVDGVVIPDRRSAKITSSVCRASSGACEHLRIAKVVNLNKAVEKLKEKGFWVIGTSDRADISINQMEILCPLAIAMGSEQKGIGRLLLSNCDLVVKIKTSGKIPSLNVSVATGIILHEVMKKLKRI
ncbi:MAG: 23S rRNA (guanosine(2251)-2'-O)-methyltransferase RlmB [Actinobacteria bacterium]|nr:23S rRNA (guanosine(2251)-2'-O)-methyltransferase RlmB [Actinomycetota bacterium]